MRPRLPLDARLTSTPFRVADARAAGVGEGRLRGADLERPFHGVRTARSTDSEHAYAPLLRDGERFSHVSAARLWDVPIPLGLEDVHTTMVGGSRARSRGVVGHRASTGTAVIRAGLPASAPTTLFLELANVLGLHDLVAAGDHLVHDPRILDPRDPRPHLPLADLLAGAARATGRGAPRARAAAALVRAGAESPMETRLRLLARDAGLPEPVLQFELVGGRRRVGWFDLAWPERRLIAEYDGDQHRTSTRQYDRDIERFDAAYDLGWHVVRVRAPGLNARSSDTRDRLRRAYQRSL